MSYGLAVGIETMSGGMLYSGYNEKFNRATFGAIQGTVKMGSELSHAALRIGMGDFGQAEQHLMNALGDTPGKALANVTTIVAIEGFRRATTGKSAPPEGSVPENTPPPSGAPVAESGTAPGPIKNASGNLDDAAAAARDQRHRTPVLTMHARARMETRGVSMERGQEAVDKGTMKTTPESPVVEKTVKASQSESGRATTVVEDIRTNKIITVIDKGSRK